MSEPQRPSVDTPIPSLPTSVTAFVGICGQGPMDVPVNVSGAHEFHSTFGTSEHVQPLEQAVRLFFANGGTSVNIVRVAELTADQLVSSTDRHGIRALDGSGVTVLAIPGLTAADALPVSRALEWCATQRAVLILDLPHAPWSEALQTVAQQTGPHRERAAVYHPWLVVDGHAVPPSGAVAGVIARSDAERGVWKAPAGLALRGVDGLVESLGNEESQAPTLEGVNVLREIPSRGLVVWGARTLGSTHSAVVADRYLAVRRLTDHVLRSLEFGLAFVANETNDPALWRRVRRLTEDFLHNLWRQGALAGIKAEQAYAVRCGLNSTMTAADIASGRLLLDVFLASLKPEEFDAHRLSLTTRTETGSVDLAHLVSRHIAETEANLAKVFDAAQRDGTTLLFDEADALLGNRAGLSDHHGRHADQEVVHLIERMSRERDIEVHWRGSKSNRRRLP